MTTERWWHVYFGENDDAGAAVTIVLGGSTTHPEALIARNGGRIDFGPSTWLDGTHVRYARSWPYEPTEDQIDALREELGR